MRLAINPNFPDSEAFSAIAAGIAHAWLHAKGVNPGYDREECDLDTQRISYILCRRFGIERELPELKRLPELYDGWNPQQRNRVPVHRTTR